MDREVTAFLELNDIIRSVVSVLERFIMEAMLNVTELSPDIARCGLWDKICQAYPVLASNVGIIYMSVE
jgi:hypothetical protein